ncbi:PREDICTED: phenylalanine--tRNA ligase alpha subunit isoform X1 [Polistes dominula]|uniref:phenylalanine--tRNA ligase n=1 Tax=Polistes dominula TaxID=743375 RepID=A0ABM1J4X1_POLDO|nr:PREDICTED: phenylalanine--tRNA ligase alpha subunit isoform X1 [Polistes dominula]
MAKEMADNILKYLSENDEVNSLDLAEIFNEDHQKIVGAIKSLEALGDFIETTIISKQKWELTAEGQHVLKNGSHEAAVYNAVPNDGISKSDIDSSVPFAKIGFSKALAAGWIKLDKSNDTTIVRKAVPSITDTVQVHLKNLDSIPDNVKKEYKKRKFLQEIIVKNILLKKGTKFSVQTEKLETDLTAELIANGAWKDKKFKPYNFEARGTLLEVGHLHPLLKVKSEFKKIFLEMGFTEMPTNNYVESSFWNFDALFQPQQHPARDAHDTFFISKPSHSDSFPPEYLEKVKKVHSEGGYGSQGYCYDWKLKEAQKNLLRTHTTAVSARMLYNLMQEGEFKPVKYFSIDRVFRNETLDATHLAEFHQIEGVIANYNLTLGHLIGMLYEFFKKLGITELKFKPAYNPYTEPSMEIFCYHNGLKKWIEIGNSGMFRPEMLLPMGLPEGVNVIAWGLSLERPTMIKYGLNNIRDLVGHKIDLEMVYNNPLCRLSKDSPQMKSTKIKTEKPLDVDNPKIKTEQSQCHVSQIIQNTTRIEKQKLIIFCDPLYPIYSIEKILDLAKPYLKVTVSTYTHSSVMDLPKCLQDFCLNYQNTDKDSLIDIILIWKNIGIDPIMQSSNMFELRGEINIARYFNRLIESQKPNLLIYESNGPLYANQVDLHLEKIHSILHEVSKEKLNQIFKHSPYTLGENLSIVDIVLDSIKRHKSKRK